MSRPKGRANLSRRRQSHEGGGQCPYGSNVAKHGEVLALLRKGGVDAGAAFEVLTGSFFDGKVHKTYGGKIVGSHLAVKDLRRALTEAEHMAVPMPQQAWFMIVSSQQLLAVGLSSTGQPWVCSRPAMQGWLRM